MSTSFSLTSDQQRIRDKFMVKDRLDLPFVKSLSTVDKSTYWHHENGDKFKPERLIHDIRDGVLYPLYCMDTGQPL